MNCLLCENNTKEIFNRDGFPFFAGFFKNPTETWSSFPARLEYCSACGFVQQPITEDLKSFIEDNREKFELLADEHIKQIHQFKKANHE